MPQAPPSPPGPSSHPARPAAEALRTVRAPAASRLTGGGRGGFGLVELLVAMALFVTAVLAGLPLLIRGLLDVRTGRELSTAVVHAGSAVETTLLRESFEGLGAEPGVEHFSRRRRLWLETPPPPPDTVLWERRTSLRAYSLEALDDGRIEDDEALAGEAEGAAFAVLEVEVVRPGGSSGRAVRIRTLQMMPRMP